MSAEQWVVFVEAMVIFESPDSPVSVISDTVKRIEPLIKGPGADAARSAFAFWIDGFNRVVSAKTRADVKAVVLSHICTDDPRAKSPFNIAQGLMKATCHQVWLKLYALEAGKLRTDPAEAVKDAITPPLVRGQQFFREMCEEIASTRGETAREMMSKIAGEDVGSDTSEDEDDNDENSE
jgi:hypothetical protein